MLIVIHVYLTTSSTTSSNSLGSSGLSQWVKTTSTTQYWLLGKALLINDQQGTSTHVDFTNPIPRLSYIRDPSHPPTPSQFAFVSSLLPKIAVLQALAAPSDQQSAARFEEFYDRHHHEFEHCSRQRAICDGKPLVCKVCWTLCAELAMDLAR
jgi:hypothetical protein